MVGPASLPLVLLSQVNENPEKNASTCEQEASRMFDIQAHVCSLRQRRSDAARERERKYFAELNAAKLAVIRARRRALSRKIYIARS